MQKCFFILLLDFAVAICFSGCLSRKHNSVVAIQNDNQNILYSCYGNNIIVAVENTSCGDIFLETDNGTIEIDSFRRGHYIIRPVKLGRATITIKRKKGKDYVTIRQMPYRVIQFEVTPSFAGKKNGELSNIEVREGIAPAAVFEGYYIDARYQIDSFTILVFRDGSEIFKRLLYDANGARFDDTTLNFLATVKQGDRVLFTKMTYRDFCNQSCKLNDMEFVISNAHEKRPEHGQEIRIDPITGQEVIKKW